MCYGEAVVLCYYFSLRQSRLHSGFEHWLAFVMTLFLKPQPIVPPSLSTSNLWSHCFVLFFNMSDRDGQQVQMSSWKKLLEIQHVCIYVFMERGIQRPSTIPDSLSICSVNGIGMVQFQLRIKGISILKGETEYFSWYLKCESEGVKWNS